MPLSHRILAKREVDPSLVLLHARTYLAFECVDDSYNDSQALLQACQFMIGYPFQQFIYTFPCNRSQRQELERRYMKARIHELDQPC